MLDVPVSSLRLYKKPLSTVKKIAEKSFYDHHFKHESLLRDKMKRVKANYPGI